MLVNFLIVNNKAVIKKSFVEGKFSEAEPEWGQEQHLQDKARQSWAGHGSNEWAL